MARQSLVSAALLLCAAALGACNWGYDAPVDRSRFVSAALLDDRDTVVWSYQKLRYRPAAGMRAFPDGGVPKYLDDVGGLGTLQLSTGKSHVLWKRKNRDWSPGHAGMRIQQVSGKVVLLGDGGQRKGSLVPGHQSYLLDIGTGDIETLDVQRALAERGRAEGYTYLVRGDGLIVLISPTPVESQPNDAVMPEIWLRLPGGTLRRVAASYHYEGYREGGVHYWSRGDRLHRRYDVSTGATQIVPNPRFRQVQVDVGINVASDGRGLELGRKSSAGWNYEPLAFDAPF